MEEKLLCAILQTLMYLRAEAHYVSSLLSIDMHIKYSNNTVVSDLLDEATHKVLKDLDETKTFFNDGEQEVRK